MSDYAQTVSTRETQALEVPLTALERWKIVIQLGSAMLAGGLLAVAFLQKRFGPPEMSNVADLIIVVASGVVAFPIFCIAIRGVLTMNPDTFTEQLVALATMAAMATGDFVTATLIPVIMSLGYFLEERSILGAQAAIKGLRLLHARNATLLTSEGEREVNPQTLKVGDVLLVRPGDIVAADGEIVEGMSAVDQSSVTGESVPHDVGPQSAVFAGSVNLSGVLRVRVTRTGTQTALGRVVELLRDAESSKTPVLKLIEQYASYYVPVILTVAAVVLFVTRDMTRAVAVLVVGCPSAFVLAGPTAMVAALTAASRLGILIKNTRFLESLADVNTVVLDKTGTVTLGHLELQSLRPEDNHDDQELLGLAVSCAAGSRHPASRAVVQAAKVAGIPTDVATSQIEEVGGKGVKSVADGRITLLGRREWLMEEGFVVPESPDHLGAVVWVGVKESHEPKPTDLVGCLLLADRPRPEAKQALRELRAKGLTRSILLTGDRKGVADEIGRDLGVDQVIAEVLPEQKLELVHAERAAGNSVMMVGDGVNDALALASGDVGVALGAAASDIALQSADVALMTDDLRRLPFSVELARKTRSTVHQNVLIAACISIVFLWLASVGIIAPLLGALLHNVGAGAVIVNSARLLACGDVTVDRK